MVGLVGGGQSAGRSGVFVAEDLEDEFVVKAISAPQTVVRELQRILEVITDAHVRLAQERTSHHCLFCEENAGSHIGARESQASAHKGHHVPAKQHVRTAVNPGENLVSDGIRLVGLPNIKEVLLLARPHCENERVVIHIHIGFLHFAEGVLNLTWSQPERSCSTSVNPERDIAYRDDIRSREGVGRGVREDASKRIRRQRLNEDVVTLTAQSSSGGGENRIRRIAQPGEERGIPFINDSFPFALLRESRSVPKGDFGWRGGAEAGVVSNPLLLDDFCRDILVFNPVWCDY